MSLGTSQQLCDSSNVEQGSGRRRVRQRCKGGHCPVLIAWRGTRQTAAHCGCPVAPHTDQRPDRRTALGLKARTGIFPRNGGGKKVQPVRLLSALALGGPSNGLDL